MSCVAHGAAAGARRRLAPYTVGRLTKQTRLTSGDAGPRRAALLAAHVASVAEVAARRGVLQVVHRIEQADLPLRPAEVLFFYLAAAVIGGVLVALLVSAFWGLIAAAAIAVVPWVVLKTLAERRTRAFTEQLPDMLQLMSTSLRSGFSVLQGLDAVSRQLQDPIGKEMRQVVAEGELGRPVVAALDDVARRVRSEDFSWVVSAIGIQREIGGNLAELLDIVAATMLARARLRREAKTLTAEGRLGAVIISILPIAIGLFVYAVNPSYINPLLHSGAGEILFYGSIGLAIVGILWIRRIVHFEV